MKGWLRPTALVGLLVAIVAHPMTAHAAGESIYVKPTNGVQSVNTTFTVEVRANSNTTQVNAVQVELSYSAAQMQYVSADANGSGYDTEAVQNGKDGKVSMIRGSTKPLTGDQLVTKLLFKAITPGSATVQIDGKASYLAASSSDHRNVSTAYGSGQFTLIASAEARPNPVPTQYPIAKPAAGASPAISITANPTEENPQPQPTLLPNQAEIKVNENATIEVTPAAGKTVSKVEYIINGRVVATVTSAPYGYAVDVKGMRNGNYKLTVKVYYTDGKVDSVDSALKVANAMSLRQIGLQLRHYAWLVLLILMGVGVFVYLRFLRATPGYESPEAFGSSSNGSVPAQPVERHDKDDPEHPLPPLAPPPIDPEK